ncbi:hypothetical protein [Ligilactobacillus saerimneri]|uniref:hypothetical protein n=1 Tax=Ligilactobacillus saerimneri TaxID=228229 RepID=UPI001C11141C|nr:hypothetical protein [Ligilactobacillus saerimneri]MBU5308864.1 hypothetical protein [Ligilactobacillus saerimneri]
MNKSAVNWTLYRIRQAGEDPVKILPKMIKLVKKEAPDNVIVLATLKDAYKQALATTKKQKQARKKLDM